MTLTREIRPGDTLFARNDTWTELGSNLPFRGEMMTTTCSVDCAISIHWCSQRPTTGPCPTSDACLHFQIFKTHFNTVPPPVPPPFNILHVVHSNVTAAAIFRDVTIKMLYSLNLDN